MAMNRRQLLGAAAGAAAASALPRTLFAAERLDDPVFQAFQAARAEHAWTLGFVDAPAAGYDSRPRLVRGRAPDGLAGTLYRNGPGRFSRAGWRYRHWFDGDGLINAWRIGGGEARHSARFAMTEKLRRERAAGRFLMPTFGSDVPDQIGAGSNDAINAANTSLLDVDGELLALWEGGSPWRLDPQSLESAGPKHWSAESAGLPFSAHPKRDPDGRVWNFGQDAFNARAIVWRIGADGALERAELVSDMPGGLMHDFAVTDRSLVFLAGSFRAQSFRVPIVDGFEWEPDTPMTVVALDKDDLSRRRTWELPPGFLFHVGGAWEDADGAIHLDAALSPDARFAFEGARQLMRGESAAYGEASSRMTRITLYPDGRVALHEFGDVAAEFPQIDRRRTGLKRRYTWHVGWDMGDAFADRLVRRDLESGARDAYRFGPDHIVEEAMFVPARPGAAEGEGWMIGTALNLAVGRSELHALDARDLAAGPVAVWRAPYAVPLGFHGLWLGA